MYDEVVGGKAGLKPDEVLEDGGGRGGSEG